MHKRVGFFLFPLFLSQQCWEEECGAPYYYYRLYSQSQCHHHPLMQPSLVSLGGLFPLGDRREIHPSVINEATLYSAVKNCLFKQFAHYYYYYLGNFMQRGQFGLSAWLMNLLGWRERGMMHFFSSSDRERRNEIE